MEFTAKVTQEARCIRIDLAGEAGLGRLLSLFQLLELDSRNWPQPAVLVDLHGLEPPFLPDNEQEQVALAVARAFIGKSRVALLGPPGGLREAGGVRAFHDEVQARAWLAGA